MEKKTILSLFVIGLMLVSSGISVSAVRMEHKSVFKNGMSQPLTNGIINITANETWAMLNNAGDGIQFYIDVRRNDEWNSERIDTPIPEHPRHYNLHLLQDATMLEKFMSLYGDYDTLIIACKSGGRSWKAANIILNAGYTGTLHNMVGGLLGWKAAGLPTVVQGGIYNITVEEAYELWMDTANGIQIPIDVRFDYEWYSGFIDTPWPESPVWYSKPVIETPDGLATFLERYQGNEVILYCKGGYRSLLSAYIVLYAEFNGTIYNMLGGITAWQDAGYPIRNNTEPDAPTIDGPTKAAPLVNITFELSTTDAEGDGVYYLVDWNDTTTTEIGPFAHDEIVEVIHFWDEEDKGTTFTIAVKAWDTHGNESDWTTHDIKIPRTRTSVFNMLELLFEKFPLASTVLRYLLG